MKSNKKMLIGSTIRRLRRQRNISQIELSNKLAISASYLNLIENNRRNLTGTLVIKLAELFNIELSEFKTEEDPNLYANMLETFSDEIFENTDLNTSDIKDLVINQPILAKAIRLLYDKYCFLNEDNKNSYLINKKDSKNGNQTKSRLPTEIVSDFLQENKNYFSTLESISEKVRNESIPKDTSPELLSSFLIDILFKKYRTRTLVLPPDLHHSTVRKYDPLAKTLVVSDLLPVQSKAFIIAQQIALFAADDAINKIIEESKINTNDAIALARIALTNYFAGALMMPYNQFKLNAINYKYDIEKLMHKFGVSFEQCCHRLLTLQKPGNSGIPFHFLRVDIAGNLSKRISFSGIHLPRYSGACPRWNIYSSFTSPENINLQISELPDGERYFCIARSLKKSGGGYGLPDTFYSIGLGCELSHAQELIYYDKMGNKDSNVNITKVGISCRTCSRNDCRQRTHPPVNRKIHIDENVRGLSSYITPLV